MTVTGEQRAVRGRVKAGKSQSVTHLLSQVGQVVVNLLGRGQVSQRGQQGAPDGAGAPAAGVLLPLHVVLGPVEGKHPELGEETLQDGLFPGDGPELVHLRHHSAGKLPAADGYQELAASENIRIHLK